MRFFLLFFLAIPYSHALDTGPFDSLEDYFGWCMPSLITTRTKEQQVEEMELISRLTYPSDDLSARAKVILDKNMKDGFCGAIVIEPPSTEERIDELESQVDELKSQVEDIVHCLKPRNSRPCRL